MRSSRPAPDEYGPDHQRYVSLVPDGDVVETLGGQLGTTTALLRAIPVEDEARRPGPGRWCPRELVRHVVDFERVMAFRALWFARGAPDALGSMDQDAWTRHSGATATPLAALLDEWSAVRRANVLFAEALDDHALGRGGEAAGSRVSVRALLWIIAGHEIHHRHLLEERAAQASSPSAG